MKPWRAKRPGGRVGKEVGGKIYFHISALSAMDQMIQDRVLDTIGRLPLDFTFAVIKVDPQRGTIGYLASPDWDTADEPTVGESYSFTAAGVMSHRPSGGKQIYHHKWQFVADNYTGFDVAAAKHRSEAWKNSGIPELSDTTRIGNRDYWDRHIKKLEVVYHENI